ncbi:hypothetical protein KI387_036289, partial [Taxus chinensis]
AAIWALLGSHVRSCANSYVAIWPLALPPPVALPPSLANIRSLGRLDLSKNQHNPIERHSHLRFGQAAGHEMASVVLFCIGGNNFDSGSCLVLQKIPQFFPCRGSVLVEVGASECSQKHGNFFQHLMDVYRNLKLWNAPDSIARCGLFHSAYSNSYVNLVISKPNVDRQKMRDLIGDEVEELVDMFCIVPRQPLIHDNMLFQFSDEDLVSALKEAEKSLQEAEADDLELQKLQLEE